MIEPTLGHNMLHFDSIYLDSEPRDGKLVAYNDQHARTAIQSQLVTI